MEIFKDRSGAYWIQGMCNTIRGSCGELCAEGCSVYEAMQKIGQTLEPIKEQFEERAFRFTR